MEQLTIEQKYQIALRMLANWCCSVQYNGGSWDDWDESFKDAAYRPSPIRKDLDEEIRKTTEDTWNCFPHEPPKEWPYGIN